MFPSWIAPPFLVRMQPWLAPEKNALGAEAKTFIPPLIEPERPPSS